MHVAVIFGALSPYHLARLAPAEKMASSLGWRLTVVERVGHQAEYPLFGGLRRESLSIRAAYSKAEPCPRDAESGRQMIDVLSGLDPDCVVFGRASRAYFPVLRWCIENDKARVLMSDSTRYDFKRVAWKEWIKTRITKLFSAGFVAGTRQMEYLVDLGMSPQHISMGYDVVDNAYFSSGADAARSNARELRAAMSLPENYFLVSSRLLARKNHSVLIDAYSEYAKRFGERAWELICIGDGPQRSSLEQQIERLGLGSRVRLVGWVDYDKLPIYYGLARACVLPSTSEQWGLAINEAMASGLPVLVSERCGCHPDLVQPEQNGIVFDPSSVSQIVDSLAFVANGNTRSNEMGAVSREIISNWTPERFAQGLVNSVEAALSRESQKIGLIDRLILDALVPS